MNTKEETMHPYRLLSLVIAPIVLAGCGSSPTAVDAEAQGFSGVTGPGTTWSYALDEMPAVVKAGKYEEAVKRISAGRHPNARYTAALRFFDLVKDSPGGFEAAMAKAPAAMLQAAAILEHGPATSRRNGAEPVYRARVLALAGQKEPATQALVRYVNEPDLRAKLDYQHCRLGNVAAAAATTLERKDLAVEAWKRYVYGGCGEFVQFYPSVIGALRQLGAAEDARELERRLAAVKKINEQFQTQLAVRCPTRDYNCETGSWGDAWKAAQYQAAGMSDGAIYWRGRQTVSEGAERSMAALRQPSAPAQPSEAEDSSRETLEAMNAIAQHGQALKQQNDALQAQRRADRERMQLENERRQQAASMQQGVAAAQSTSQQEELERLRRQVAALEAQRQQAPAATAPSRQMPAQPTVRPSQPVAQDNTPHVESFWRNNVYYLRNNGSRRVQCQVSGMFASSGIGAQPGLQPSQKAVVLFPGEEEAPFSGPVASPRFFGCRVM